MAPLDGAEGLSFGGGFIGGVHLEPDGLWLFDSATLTIEGGTFADDGDLKATGFAYRGEGEDFQLMPVRISALELRHRPGE